MTWGRAAPPVSRPFAQRRGTCINHHPIEAARRAIARRGPFFAAIAAAAAASPGLGFPFLADDWILAAQVAAPLPQASALGYFRPLYVATFWLDRRIWGLNPALFHLTNLALIALSAALVVLVVRRYTRDPFLAGAAGLFFAIHPWHVENAAWIAVRGDPLYASLALLSILAYQRWREDGRGIPVASLALFEAALLAKESAVIVPFVLLSFGVLVRRHRTFPREILSGIVPMVLVSAMHFLWLRPWALSGHPRALDQGRAIDWAKRVPGYITGAVLPADVDIIGAHPRLWAALAALVIGGLVLLARVRSGRMPGTAAVAAVVFLVAIMPSVVGFQERYLYLAAAASGTAIVSLLRTIRGNLARGLAAALVAGWLLALVHQWTCWRQAAIASRSLVADLVRASEQPGLREIVVANMPFRVRGGAVYVYDDFLPALAIAGGRPVTVRAVAFVSYPTAAADALDGPPSSAIRLPPPSASVRLRVPRGTFWGFHSLRPTSVPSTRPAGPGQLTFEADGAISASVEPSPDGTRAAYAWVSGRLLKLF